MTETTALKPDIDWGPNADGWQCLIENRTNDDLEVDYSPTSNVRWADPPIIPAGHTGRVKGVRGVSGVDGVPDPADIVFSYSRTRGPGWSIVTIKSIDGHVTRVVRNDTDHIIEADFPNQPRNEVQRVIVRHGAHVDIKPQRRHRNSS